MENIFSTTNKPLSEIQPAGIKQFWNKQIIAIIMLQIS